MVIAGIAFGGLIASSVVAVQDPVPAFELHLTEWINNAPHAVATVLHPVMQLGTLGGPILVAVGIAAFTRDWWLSATTVISGLATWFAAKDVKRIVERGRPKQYLPDILVREGDGTGLGFVSGHSAVAASAAVMIMVVLPRRWRPAAALGAGLVGIARIVHGVHLPADVVGGWCFGVLVALASLGVLDLVQRRRCVGAGD